MDEPTSSLSYGDSLRLLALQREYDQPDSVKILDKPYGDDMPVAFAGPKHRERLSVIDKTVTA
jgi:hypothetical protein